jgi:hypothetical protein
MASSSGIITNRIFEYSQEHDVCIFLYGSSALNLSSGRDIDAVAIAPHYGEVHHHQIDIELASGTRSCSLYLVPDSVFRADVQNLRYGGYYSHKFALCFTELRREGMCMDPLFVFWNTLFAIFANRRPCRVAPEMFVKSVHFEILKYRPTFARSLVKFLKDSDRRIRLADYISSNIIGSSYLEPDADPAFLFEVPRTSDYEASLYRYWKEYDKHKGGTAFWSERTSAKMKQSLDSLSCPEITDYFQFLSEDS